MAAEKKSDAQITFVTGNKNKAAEVQKILTTIKVDSRDLDLPELQGEPEDVAREKCKTAASILRSPVLIEDTSLCMNALNGLPGVYIKWFLDKLGLVGLINMLAAYSDKSAYAQCIFAYHDGQSVQDPVLFVGRCEGVIVPEPRGPKKFGWDPVFQPKSSAQTFAEMTPEDKNKISHRALSLQKVEAFFALGGNKKFGSGASTTSVSSSDSGKKGK